MNNPLFQIGNKVRVINDSRMAGEIVSYSFDSINGYLYRITSRYYDAEKNEMIEGVMTCREVEIELFEGTTTPPVDTYNNSIEQ